MCEPVSITLGVISAGLGIAQSVASYQQAQQNVAYQNAVAEQNYQFNLMQASSARNFEQMRYDQQESIMQMNRLMAENAYADEIGQLNLRLMQEQEATAQRKAETAKQGLQARGEIAAAGRIGNTIDNLVADYYRQQAQFDFATDRNLAFATMQTQEEKRGASSRYASRLSSQQPYIKQPVLEPLKPIPQEAPSATPYIIGGISGALGGVSTGLNTAGAIKGAGYTWKNGGYRRA